MTYQVSWTSAEFLQATFFDSLPAAARMADTLAQVAGVTQITVASCQAGLSLPEIVTAPPDMVIGVKRNNYFKQRFLCDQCVNPLSCSLSGQCQERVI